MDSAARGHRLNGFGRLAAGANGTRERARLPWLVWFMLLSLVVTFFDQETPFGRSLKGVLLFATLGMCLWVIVLRYRHIRFPLRIWIPWMALTGVYCALAVAEEEWEWGQAALQRTLMMWAPPLVGAAVSTFPFSEAQTRRFIQICKTGAFVFLGLLVFRLGLPEFGRPWWVGAGHQITATLLAAVYAVLYVSGHASALLYWALTMLICVLGVGRGTTAAVAATLPLTLAPLRLERRVLFAIAGAMLGVVIFFYEPFQREWFRSGHGSLADLKFDNPDVDDSGRFGMWDVLMDGIRRRPLLGHGANANEKALFDSIGIRFHPHNDYLRLAYDYGIPGGLFFLGTIVAQCVHTLRMAERRGRLPGVLLYAGASAFVPMLVLMLGDNIVLYASFFGNLHFAILGLAYAAAGVPAAIPMCTQAPPGNTHQNRPLITQSW